RENVFMDVATILPGADFEQVIDQAIASCDAMIILISPSWASHVNTVATSYPRFEADAALRRGLLVIPILGGGSGTPTRDQLPASLHQLLRRNIRPVRSDAFDYDIEFVRKALGVTPVRRFSVLAAGLVTLLMLGAVGTLSQVPAGNPVWRVFNAPD